MSPEARRSLIVYGNCQAEAIAAILSKYPPIADEFRTTYLRSFNHPTDGWQKLTPQEVASCSVLLEQHDDAHPFPYHTDLPSDCRSVTFPDLDFNLLWPFTCVNPFSEPEPPLFPFGRFPYGDRVIIQCLTKNMPLEEIVEYYMTGWQDYKIDLNRLFEIENARLTARDEHCDVKMAPETIANFRTNRLFWTLNHPTTKSLVVVLERLLHAAFPHGGRYADIANTLTDHFARDPLGVISVPVHPKIAEHFELEWYDPLERYAYVEGTAYTYEDYFRTMIETSLRFKGTKKDDSTQQQSPSVSSL